MAHDMRRLFAALAVVLEVGLSHGAQALAAEAKKAGAADKSAAATPATTSPAADKPAPTFQATQPTPEKADPTAGAARTAAGLKALDERRYDEALKAFNEAYGFGDPDGAFYLGRMVELGVGVQGDFDKARILYLAAADKGSARAMNRLGLMHYRGERVLQDYAAAFELICKAAEKGDADGAFNCAGLHADGRGTPRDVGKAIALYEQAAAKGHIGAINALGFAYRDGLGVPADAAKAVAFFERAAAKGNPVALFELGAAYEAGRAVPQDLAKAHLYYNLASARQHPSASPGSSPTIRSRRRKPRPRPGRPRADRPLAHTRQPTRRPVLPAGRAVTMMGLGMTRPTSDDTALSADLDAPCGLPHPVRRAVSFVAALTLLVQPPLATLAQAQQIADPRAPIQFRPGVGVSGNGTPVIAITTPSFGGVSHNKFQRYDVDTRGVILNNSGAGGTSVIGGAVGANPNLARSRPASVIVNEVTGAGTSTLNGPTEVFGGRADVVVANPNGVGCVGCTFVNAGRVTLTTGVPSPDYTAGTVSYAVTGGTVSVSGAGLSGGNGESLGRIDLIGRQLRLDGPVVAQGAVRLRAGAMTYDAAGDVVTPLAGAAAVTGPAIASSGCGTIRAGTISVLSQDADLGVMLDGTLTALSGPIEIRSFGDLQLAASASAGDLRIEADGAVAVTGRNEAVGRITVAGRSAAFAPDSLLIANDSIVVETLRDLSATGTLVTGRDVSLTAAGALTASGTVSASGRVVIEGDSVVASDLQIGAAAIALAGQTSVQTDRSDFQAQGDFSVSGRDVTFGQGTAFAAGGRVAVDARDGLTLGTVLDDPNLDLAVGGRLAITATGGLVQDDLQLSLRDGLVNDGLLYGRVSTTLQAPEVVNTATGTIYGGDLTLAVGGPLTNLGRLLSARTLTVTAAGLVRNDGTLATDGTLTLRAQGYIAGSAQALLAGRTADLIVSGAFASLGTVQGQEGLTPQAASLRNGGVVAGGGTLTSLIVSDDLTNGGTVYGAVDLTASAGTVSSPGHLYAAAGDLTLTATGVMASGGDIIAAGVVTLKGASFTADTSARMSGSRIAATVTKNFVSAGLTVAATDIAIAAGSISLKDTGRVEAPTDRLTSGGAIANAGTVVGQDSVTVTAGGTLSNSGTVVGTSGRVTAGGEVTNTGLIGAVGGLTLSAAGQVVNGGSLLAQRGDLSLTADGIVTSTGDIIAGGHLALTAAGYESTSSSARVGGADVVIRLGTGGLVNLGQLVSASVLDVKAGDLRNDVGGRLAGADVHLALTGAAMNDGRIEATGDIALTAASLSNSGSVLANGAGTLTLAGAFGNDGQIVFSRDGTVAADSYAGGAGSRLRARNLDLTITKAVSDAGEISAAGLLNVGAGSLDVSAGGTLAAGATRLTLTGDASNAGAISADDGLSLSLGGGLANRGAITAKDLALRAGGGIGNAGRIEATGTLAASGSTLDNAAGAKIAAGVVSFSLSGAASNAGIFAATDTAVIQAASLTNRGAAGQVATLTAPVLAITVSGALSNGPYAAIRAASLAYLRASTTDLDLYGVNDEAKGLFAFGGDLGLILTGQGLTIDAGRSLIVAQGRLALSVAGDLTVLGTIASQGDLTLITGGDLSVGNANANGGQIFTRGNGQIQAAGNITNTASTIQASGGLSLTAGGTVTNTRTAQNATTSVVSPSTHASKSPEKYEDVTTTTTETSGAAQIVAGGNLVIQAGAIRNDASVIQAGGVLGLGATTVDNLSRQTGSYLRMYKVGGSVNIGSVIIQGWLNGPAETPALMEGDGGVRIVAGTLTNTGTITGPTVAIAAQVVVNGLTGPTAVTPTPRTGGSTIDLASQASGGSLNAAAVRTGGGGALGTGDTASGRSASAQLTGGINAALNAPARTDTGSGIVYLHAAPLPGAGERGPDWILAQVGDTRSLAGLLVFADPTVEQGLIRQAAVDRTGRALLDPSYTNPEQQRQALYQGTVDCLKAHPEVHLGDTLTDAQKAAVTAPMLWYENRVIDGQTTLVPVLILPPGYTDRYAPSTGGQISGNDVFIAADSVTNTGSLLATGSLIIDAGTFLNERRVVDVGTGAVPQQVAQAGGLVSGSTVSIFTTGDLTNRGGSLVASQNLTLLAGGNILIASQAVSTTAIAGGKNHWTVTSSTTQLGGTVAAGGQLVAVAGGSLAVQGSTVAAGGDAVLAATGPVSITATEDSTATTAFSRKGGLFASRTLRATQTDDTTHASDVSAGGALTIVSGSDLTVTASHLSAGDDLTVSAAGSVALQAGQDRHTSTVSATSGGLGLFGGGGNLDVWRTKRVAGAVDRSENALTTLDAGGNVTVVAGQNLAVTGSAVVAGGVARLAAGHDLTIDPGTNRTLSVTTRSVAGVGIGASVNDNGVSTSAGYHSKSSTVASDTTTAEASAIVGGTGVVITAGNDATLTATDIASGGDVTVAAGRNLSLLSQGQVSHSAVTRSQTFIGLKTDASQNVSGAVNQLSGAVATAGSGHGGSGYQAIGAASGVMQATDGAMALTHPALSASVTLGASHSQSWNDAESDTQRPTTVQAAGSITLAAGQDAHLQGTQAQAGDRIDVAAGRDLTIESATSRGASSQSASSWQVGAGIGGSVGLSGSTVGVTANGAVSQSQGGSQSTTNVNAQLSAGMGLSLTSGRDTTVAGANILAPDVTVTVGGDLTVVSRQDTTQGGSTSFHASASVTIGEGTDPSSGSFSVGRGQSSSDRAWTDHQTTIQADDGLTIDVGGHTQVDGAVIASGTGNLSLSTGTLSVTDRQDHDRGHSLDVTVGGNFATGRSDGKGQQQPTTTQDGRPVGASISGQVADHDKEGVSRGTIGSGTITIRDPAHQTQDVATINRDPSQAQAVTKNTSSGVKFYGSDSSIREIAGGFQGIQEGAEQIGKAARDGFKDLPAQVQVTVEKVAANVDLSAATVEDAIRTIIDALVTNGNISRDQADAAKELGIKAYYQDSAYTALGGGY